MGNTKGELPVRQLILAGSTALLLAACSTSVPRLSQAELGAAATSARADIVQRSEAVTGTIDVYEAMARALKSNLDHRVAMMEVDLAQADSDLSGWEQLPKVVASGGYFGRTNEAGASSLSLLSGRQSLEPSTSLEREYAAGDLTASWNILDFGLSRIRAEQLANESHIAEERHRKAVITIMQDVHAAYWRAVGSERLLRRLQGLEADVRAAFADSRRIYEGRRTAPMPALTFQRELNDIQSQAQRLQREMGEAKAELAALMGLMPDQDFTLTVPARFDTPRQLTMGLTDMMDVAVRQRPEVRESLYRARIGEEEIRAATLRAFPSLEAFAGLNASTNDFLFNQDWVAYGAKASWNLLDVFATGDRKKRAGAQLELERARATAAAMAVMTQVAVSRQRYTALAEEYATAEVGASVQTDITSLVSAQAQAASASRQTLVREQMNAILAEARRDAVHAYMREAEAQIYASMGFDPYPAGVSGTEDLQTLAAALRELWTARPI